MTEFKPGDRVECVNNHNALLYENGASYLALEYGEVYTVAADRGSDVTLAEVKASWRKDRFIPADPIPATPEKTQKPALVLEVGKAYRNRRGECFEIVGDEGAGWMVAMDGGIYRREGGYWLAESCPTSSDLIAEWSDEPAATPEVGDRVVTLRYDKTENLEFVPGMEQYVGVAGNITEVDWNGDYCVHEWWWPASALRLVSASSTPTPDPAPDFPGLKRIREIREEMTATRPVSVDDVRAFVKAGQAAADPNAAMLARDTAAIARIQSKPAKPITQSTAARLAEMQREQAASAAQAERDRIAANLTKF